MSYGPMYRSISITLHSIDVIIGNTKNMNDGHTAL